MREASMTDDQTPAPDRDETHKQDGGADAATEPAGPEGEVDALRDEIASLKDQMLRVAADAENAKRRAERDASDARAYAIQKFARDLLGVADNLQRAMLHAPKDAADPLVKNLAIGLEMTERDLLGAFERNGLKKIDPPKGEKFDPHLHQAMQEQAADDVQAGAVVQVVQPGYELFGRLVRPALVIVAARGPRAAAETAGAANDKAASGVDTKA
jgi:molecular chaperone GrpE